MPRQLVRLREGGEATLNRGGLRPRLRERRQATIAEIASQTRGFAIRLTRPTMFDAEPILYLGVESPGWWELHRALVDALAAQTGAEMHPWEISGWIPHATVLRVMPELRDHQDEIVDVATRELSPFPTFQASTLRMYRQDDPKARWRAVRDFPMYSSASGDHG